MTRSLAAADLRSTLTRALVRRNEQLWCVEREGAADRYIVQRGPDFTDDATGKRVDPPSERS